MDIQPSTHRRVYTAGVELSNRLDPENLCIQNPEFAESIADRVYFLAMYTNWFSTHRRLMALYWYPNQVVEPLPLREFEYTDL